MMAFSLLAIVGLGFTVWAHHMFVSGMQNWIRIPMMVTTAIIAVPTGIKVFSWLATLWRGVLKLDTPMLWALGFITMFVLGGISGVMLAIIPFTIHVSDTYLIVAHASFGVGLSTLVFLYNMVVSWKGGPRASANPWRALTLEWQVSSPPPIFNFDSVPTVVGGPYEYGVPGAVHGIFKSGAEVPQPAGAATRAEEEGATA